MDAEKYTPEPTESPVDSRATETPAPSAAPDYSEIVAAIDGLKALVGDVSSTIINRFAATSCSPYNRIGTFRNKQPQERSGCNIGKHIFNKLEGQRNNIHITSYSS